MKTIKTNNGGADIQELYDNNKIDSPTIELALTYCRQSNIGEYKCCVKTDLGWCCDLCLKNELLYLNNHGINTINSCCGHGQTEAAFILTTGDFSKKKMEELGYTKHKHQNGCTKDTCWYPKTKFIYTVKEN